MDITYLLNRKTVKNFLPDPVPEEIIQNALHIAWRSPTAVNSRPVRIYDITGKQNADWLSVRQAPQTAKRLFLLCFSQEEAERNMRTFLTQKFETTERDMRIEETLNIFLRFRSQDFCREQAHVVAGYFSSALEIQGVAGCWISGFDKQKAKDDLKIPGDITPEAIYACGYANPQNPGTCETDFVRSFENFYTPAA